MDHQFHLNTSIPHLMLLSTGPQNNTFTYHPETSAPHTHKRKKLILCFDGTGNKFKGNDGDTNILKIFRMLDRSGSDQCTSFLLSFTSFDQHVIGGYKFLMRFYAPGDDIYLFGFSRGAYTARFLAEMLDHVGLVSQGNEEMRKDGEGWGARKKDMYNYMRAFRETFARPRSAGFPYTARSTARVIRHAVGIDERRAKFRQDLVEKADIKEMARRRSFRAEHLIKSAIGHRLASKSSKNNKENSHPYQNGNSANAGPKLRRFSGSREALGTTGNNGDGKSLTGSSIHIESGSDDENEKAEQDIEEVWFPGAHGDIGGGWDLPDGEEPLSHGPLVWMVREARRAGVVFDKERMKQMNVWPDEFETEEWDPKLPETPIDPVTGGDGIPKIEVSSTSSTHNLTPTPINGAHPSFHTPTSDPTPSQAVDPKTYLLNSYTHGKIHDCLCHPSGGLSLAGTLGWRLMEYLPFRRMDLQPDGSWKSIVWPLPCGEVRDIPETVKIHNSVIRRMKADEKGVRRAPEKAGIGEWEVLREEGSLVGEVLVKKKAVEKGLIERP
ncbi:hypothetical protein C7212DRAFT_359370 [Tuber magnatum]|uniref:T6SS Phospholipase effector Tle1-like catalytic domain-containing protein n=1 Tax=Tuber magnatum TaxID=42249 RepID=A0A317SGG1_9PEZI|nr:hypothetical protein C7212DRAFT_359370 [Tuber magnatum]